MDDVSSGRGTPKVVDLKLYIARSTPNSVRAEQNLYAALDTFRDEDIIFDVEIVDVFTSGKRAVRDNVIVTPTLIVRRDGDKRTIVGDLSETIQLHAMLAP
ncbi:MAG: hypothetical protein JWR75_1009 [Devosia sp.]|nr:hypothetical protein [Devosia sp.]